MHSFRWQDQTCQMKALQPCYLGNNPNTSVKVLYLFVERRMPEVVPRSAHRGAVQDHSQIHLDSPPSLAGPGSMGVQQHNPVDSF